MATTTLICWASATNSFRHHPSTSGRQKGEIFDVESSSTHKNAFSLLLTVLALSVIPFLVSKSAGEPSPFDGDWLYWTRRRGTHLDTPPKVAYLLKRQQGRCASCGLYFTDGDRLEIDHVLPTVLGGRDNYSNLHLLHRHCHDQKTAADGS